MRILIVGAGVMGLAAAEALTNAGHRVFVYEQGQIPHAAASSVDQHRLIRYPYGAQDGYARLVAPAYAAWDRLWQRLGRSHYVETGTLVARLGGADGGEAVWLERSAEGLERIGQAFERLDAAALAERFPLLISAPGDHGLYLTSGGMLLARPILESLATRIKQLGGGLFPRGRVTAVDCARARVTFSDGTSSSGDLVIVTAGPWLPDLIPNFAARVTPSRQAYAYLEPPERTRAAWAGYPVVLDIGAESGFYLVPPAAGTAMKVGDHSFTLTGHPDRDREGRAEDVAVALAAAGRCIAGFDDYKVSHIGTCFYGIAEGQRFIAERRGAAWVLTGFSGHGFKFAPLIAEALADVVAGRRSETGFGNWIAGAGEPADA